VNIRKKNILTIMTEQAFRRYKENYRITPRCISCGKSIVVGDKMMRFVGRQTKYVCEECSKKDVIVYQYPKSRNPYKKSFNKNIWGWSGE